MHLSPLEKNTPINLFKLNKLLKIKIKKQVHPFDIYTSVFLSDILLQPDS